MPNKITRFLNGLSRKDIVRAARIGIYGTLIAIIVVYGLNKTHDLVFGINLNILSPDNGATLTDSHVRIVGLARGASVININDGEIIADEQGNFVEQYILAPGLNTFSIRTEDYFGRNQTKILSLVYDETKD